MVLKKGRIVDGGLDAENKTELIIENSGDITLNSVRRIPGDMCWLRDVGKKIRNSSHVGGNDAGR